MSTVDPNYMVGFLSKCVQANKNLPEEMCEVAQERIAEIDQEMKEIENLRAEKANLKKIIKQFSKPKPKQVQSFDWSIPKEQLTEHQKTLFSSICKFIEKNPGQTPGTIMREVTSVEEHASVYAALKWLGTQEIIKRGEGRGIFPGQKWNERPEPSSHEKNEQETARQAS